MIACRAVADWAVVVLVAAWLVLVAGVVLGKLLALMDRVATLEASASEVSYELVAADQRRDVELMRERVQNTENELIRLSDDP